MLAVDPEAQRLATSMRLIEQAFLIGVEGATEVWLVRHGDCYDGITESLDPGLSPRGREQARRLGLRLRRLGFDAVYSSPLRRALETAAAFGAEVSIDERLVEIAIDRDQDPELAAMNRWVGFKEEPEQVLARMRAAIQAAVERHPGGRVIIVSHGGAILGYLTDVLRLEYGRLRVLPYYTSVTIVRILGTRRMAGSIADTAHLEGLADG